MSNEIRVKARARRVKLGLPLEDALGAASVVAACLADTGLERQFFPPDDPLLAGAQAVLNFEMQAIYQDNSRPFAMQQFDAVHEFAHFWLHAEACPCTEADLDPSQTAEATTGAASIVEGYAPRQKRENEANLYAAEMLLPLALARRLFTEEGLSSGAIADALGLPAAMVQMQLADALLLPAVEGVAEAAPTAASAAVTLDESQLAAAQIESGPLLLGAGPGTGKTKTLVGRCQFLTRQKGVSAEKILALTFSRKAAGEMQERLAAAGVGTEKAGPWVGTFHSFGLEVLGRYGAKIGLAGDIKLLGDADAVTLLENNLAELKLDALDNLYNPAVHLGAILGQIKRAKDELCPPERYAKLCAAMRAPADATMAVLEAQIEAAGSDKGMKGKLEDAAREQGRAAKAAEVAHCYGVYERLLRESGFLDFGGLISRTVELLEGHPDALADLQEQYPHVLADEYQDVNRACARLVRLLAGERAEGLWAVGDHRQSIYQFQGASPANVAAFERDYPTGKRLELGVNYRSRAPIVELCGQASRALEGGTGIGPVWRAHRGTHQAAPYPAVTHAASPDDIGQADGIARAIADLKAGGWEHRQQAILCRSHAQAGALAALLSARNIPVLYQGPLLDRPEVKDLLCVLALFADPEGSALVRASAFPEYTVPQADALAVIQQMQATEMPLLEALREPGLHPGLRKLGEHLAELETMENEPAAILRHYLFGLSQYLRFLSADEPLESARLGRTMAIHQLLSMAADAGKRLVAPRSQHGPPNGVREFLGQLRRLQATGGAPRGTLPPEAERLDAVRLLTAHAAKGLEYPVVFVPNLGKGQFPGNNHGDGIPTPPGLADAAGGGLDEEECLFFVALSRARDHVILSRAETSGSDKPVAPSPLLSLVRPHLAATGIEETAWPAGRVPAPPEDDALTPAPESLPEYSSSALETYLRCPRQYHYGKALSLPGAFGGAGYPQFHDCVHRTLRWMEDGREQGRAPAPEEVAAQFETVWAKHGPVGHLHELKYKDSALGMLRAGGALGAETEEPAGIKSLRATLANCHIHVRPDAIRRDTEDNTLIIVRHRTGRTGDSDHTDKKLALYRRAAQQTHPDTPVRVELRYLSDGTIKVVPTPEKKQELKWEADRLLKYEKAARGIQLGLFPARPESRDECGTCAYALICPL